jgi:hypothetical protein
MKCLFGREAYALIINKKSPVASGFLSHYGPNITFPGLLSHSAFDLQPAMQLLTEAVGE